VTASEERRGGLRPLVDEALDLFVYAPVGLIASSLDELTTKDVPELAQKGRGRIGRLLSNARIVGHMTIAMGRRTLGSELARWSPPAPADAPPAEEPVAATPRKRKGDRPEFLRRVDPAPELAIPGYEALSASQVVRRLDGLGRAELTAIYEHEAATRRRRTILHRTQQLLGHEGSPGPASWPA
jgi:hypothetical protein